MCMAFSLAIGPAMAVTSYSTTDGNGYAQFVGSGSAGYNYTFWVAAPYALGLDAAYWNMTVYCDHTGTEATNLTYYVHIHINDGATNLTKNVTINAKNDVRVYSNASHDSTAITTLVKNTHAVYYVELLRANGAVLADYHGEVSIYDSALTAGLLNALMLIIPMVILVMIVGWIGNLTGKIGDKSRRK